MHNGLIGQESTFGGRSWEEGGKRKRGEKEERGKRKEDPEEEPRRKKNRLENSAEPNTPEATLREEIREESLLGRRPIFHPTGSQDSVQDVSAKCTGLSAECTGLSAKSRKKSRAEVQAENRSSIMSWLRKT